MTPELATWYREARKSIRNIRVEVNLDSSACYGQLYQVVNRQEDAVVSRFDFSENAAAEVKLMRSNHLAGFAAKARAAAL